MKILLIIFLCSCSPCIDEFPTFDFETNRGIKVVVEDNVSIPDVEILIDETLIFWNKYFNKDIIIPKNTYSYFIKENATYKGTFPYGGLAYGCGNNCGTWLHIAVISNGNEYKLKYVFAHELTHILIEYNNGTQTEEKDHILMRESGFDKYFGQGYI